MIQRLIYLSTLIILTLTLTLTFQCTNEEAGTTTTITTIFTTSYINTNYAVFSIDNGITYSWSGSDFVYWDFHTMSDYWKSSFYLNAYSESDYLKLYVPNKSVGLYSSTDGVTRVCFRKDGIYYITGSCSSCKEIIRLISWNESAITGTFFLTAMDASSSLVNIQGYFKSFESSLIYME